MAKKNDTSKTSGSWKKHWRIISDGSMSPVNGGTANYSQGYLDSQAQFAFRNYQATLPDVYSGHPNRVDRYTQYEAMDADSEINASLDILAEFCTQATPETNTAFKIFFHEEATASEISILKEQLTAWYSMNEFTQRIFKIFRNTLKYGDQIFVRDPENFKWNWSEMNRVTKVVVNESKGKEPEVYFIKDLSPNLQNNTITRQNSSNDAITHAPYMGARAYTQGADSFSPNSRFGANTNEFPVDAQHVIHCSLSEGLDVSWPFGVSILEGVFKVFKQKELLEDALLIYRVQRAPERRVFKIDVGNMPAHMQMSFLERVKNEIHQRRIPTQGGGGQNLMDASYNPLSINEDYFFPQSADGRGSSVEVLPGGQNLGEIEDLKYFQNKLFRGLRIPSSYLPVGKDDSDRTLSDGKVTTALIQEYRFNEYCKRLQNFISKKFDSEFKLYMKWRGFNLDNSMFELRFSEPQNFASYRELELDAQRISSFSAVKDTEFLSKRFMLKKYLGLTEVEMEENERLWHEERGTADKETAASGTDLRNVGITPGGISSDLDTMGDLGGDMAGGGEEVPGAEAGIGAPGTPGGEPAPTAPSGGEPSLAV